jgi:outer membrane protein assembly factor BamD
MTFAQVGLAVVLCGAAACSSTSKEHDNAEALYKDAEDDLQADRYIMAHEKFGKLRSKYPYSKFAILATLRNADTYFKEESYFEAAAAYQTFRDLHPNHEKAAYALFMVGESYFLDTPTQIARDLTSAGRAISSFQEYLKRFPFDENAQKAKDRIAAARDVLAEKELYVGNFYYKRDLPLSAKGRYERILNLYGDSKFATEAKTKLEVVNRELKPE